MHSVRPWLAHYDADVAHSIAPYPDKTLIDYLADLSRADARTVLERLMNWTALGNLDQSRALLVRQVTV